MYGFAFALSYMALLPAQSQTVDGRAVAANLCVECHNINRDEADPKNESAPAFAAIANMSSATILSIKVFLKTPHANMPNIILSEAEIDSVAEYIMALNEK
jgi:mono/diheme cytochrome c family protein